MGDRANIAVLDSFPSDRHPKEAVFIYGHWSGSSFPAKLAAALQSPEGRARADDGTYLARIIFDHVVAGAGSKETGYGLSTRLTDNEYPILVVDVERQVIVELPESEYDINGFTGVAGYAGIPFDKYTGVWAEESAHAGQ